MSAVGVVLKPLKPCERCLQDGKKSAASYGKSRLPRKAFCFLVLDVSQQGSRCCPHKCKLNPVEISQFLTTCGPKTSPRQKATQTSSDVLAPYIPSVPSALFPCFPSPCSVVPAAASMFTAVCVPGLGDLSPGQWVLLNPGRHSQP